MFSAQFDGLNHWSFIDLYRRNQEVYYSIYQQSYRAIKERIPTDPSIDALETGVREMILDETNFRYHCNSKQSFNTKFKQDCAEKFSKYIVFNIYRR